MDDETYQSEHTGEGQKQQMRRATESVSLSRRATMLRMDVLDVDSDAGRNGWQDGAGQDRTGQGRQVKSKGSKVLVVDPSRAEGCACMSACGCVCGYEDGCVYVRGIDVVRIE